MRGGAIGRTRPFGQVSHVANVNMSQFELTGHIRPTADVAGIAIFAGQQACAYDSQIPKLMPSTLEQVLLLHSIKTTRQEKTQVIAFFLTRN